MKNIIVQFLFIYLIVNLLTIIILVNNKPPTAPILEVLIAVLFRIYSS